ncbi:MAG: Hsp20 family protein [Acidobacteria bacterium]|nr:Hsp20 family protein [Acidobacteriota bacterium]
MSRYGSDRDDDFYGGGGGRPSRGRDYYEDDRYGPSRRGDYDERGVYGREQFGRDYDRGERPLSRGDRRDFYRDDREMDRRDYDEHSERREERSLLDEGRAYVREKFGRGRGRGRGASRSHVRCRDIMTRDVTVATRETMLVEVARMMRDEDTGVIPVVERAESLTDLAETRPDVNRVQPNIVGCHLSPVTILMAESIERYMRMLPKANSVRCTSRLWYPPADVYRVQDGWVVKVELAGVRVDELEIIIEGDSLSIAGCRRDTVHTETVSYHQLEITYSRFEKKIRFPCPIEGTRIETGYQDGLLVLRLRGSEECG